MIMRFLELIIAVCMFFAVQCTMDHIAGGGGSDVGNGVVVGKIVTGDGKSPANTRVLLIPSDFNPMINDFSSEVLLDTVGSDGVYMFTAPKKVIYNISASLNSDGSRLLAHEIHPAMDSSVVVRSDTLRKPGALQIMVPDGFDRVNGYLYIPGTTSAAPLAGVAGFVRLDSMPPGIVPVLCYAAKAAAAVPIRYNIAVASGTTTLLYNTAWSHARRLMLNTGASGAAVAGTNFNFPVLVRLTKDNFNFSEAKSGGGDIRFAKPDNSPLAYQIERWDSAAQLAEVWVNVDTVFGGDSAHYITLYWGNSTVPSASNGAAVFDTAEGFQGVWHMNDAPNAPLRDATYNKYDGTRFGQNASSPGEIGVAQTFDGSSTYMQMMGSASGKMNFQKDGFYCVSAWVYTDTLDMNYHIIASKGNTQYNLQIRKNNNWQFTEYKNLTGWEVTNAPATSKTWIYLAGVRSGVNQYLYVNGVCASNTPWIETNVFARYTGDDFKIGRRTDLVDYFFNGMIDEVRVSSTDLSADWIKLCYMNQMSDDKLFAFK
jgi:hypothetical protein